MLAAVDGFVLTIQGKGGHGARPNVSVDPIVVGAEIVNALQTIVSREIDPVEQAVVTIGAFNAGEAANVIPDTAVLRGTVRSFSPEVRQQLATRIQAIIRGIAEGMRATVDLVYDFGFPPTVNDPAMTELAQGALAEVVGEENVLEAPIMMGAEDFSYFLENVPGCFWFVGTNNPDKGFTWGHHHPKFDIDEDGMAIGMETMTQTVLRYFATPTTSLQCSMKRD
jgi:amidohydrolase